MVRASFARQQWRAWIETTWTAAPTIRSRPFARQQWRAWIETSRCRHRDLQCRHSPASNGGRGLKPPGPGIDQLVEHHSPASNGGRGLKPHWVFRARRRCSFARQQWRAWIETRSGLRIDGRQPHSPASNGGRGLKRPDVPRAARRRMHSPASNGGRGLKPRGQRQDDPARLVIRPPAMAGVD